MNRRSLIGGLAALSAVALIPQNPSKDELEKAQYGEGLANRGLYDMAQHVGALTKVNTSQRDTIEALHQVVDHYKGLVGYEYDVLTAGLRDRIAALEGVVAGFTKVADKFVPELWIDDIRRRYPDVSPGLILQSQYLIRHLADGLVMWEPEVWDQAMADKRGRPYVSIQVEDITSIQKIPALRERIAVAMYEKLTTKPSVRDNNGYFIEMNPIEISGEGIFFAPEAYSPPITFDPVKVRFEAVQEGAPSVVYLDDAKRYREEAP